MLGAVAAVSDVVSYEALKDAVRSTVPPKTIELNLAALEEGYQEGQRLKSGAAS